MSLWEERAARNEALFREVNEQVRDLAETFRDGADATFVCECSDADCTEHVRLSLATYESIRADPRRFVLRPGHESDVERVVEQADGYTVVEKEGLAGRIAARTDPRSE